MKKKIFLIVYFFLFLTLIVCKSIFVNTFCRFYNICEWGIYLFIVPTAYILFTLFSKPKNQFIYICVITLGIIISILLNRECTTGFILQKLIATISGSLVTYLIIKQFEGKAS